jgi:MraZ protein
MSPFLGTHQNKLDAKGRVSIPASFRTALRGQAASESGGPVALVLRPSHTHAGIEGWPVAAFEALATPLDRLDMFGEDHEDLSTALYADAHPVESDKEGRIVLPDMLVHHAKLSDSVTFMGLGRIFQIWEPAAAEQRRVEARITTRSRGLTLPGAAAPVHA